MLEIGLNIVLVILVIVALYQDWDGNTEASSIAWWIAMIIGWFKLDIPLMTTAMAVIPYLCVGLVVALYRWNMFCKNYTTAALETGYLTSKNGDTSWTSRSRETEITREELLERIGTNLNPQHHREFLVGMVLNWPIGVVSSTLRSIASLAKWCVNGWSFSMFKYLANRQVKLAGKHTTKGDAE